MVTGGAQLSIDLKEFLQQDHGVFFMTRVPQTEGLQRNQPEFDTWVSNRNSDDNLAAWRFETFYVLRFGPQNVGLIYPACSCILPIFSNIFCITLNYVNQPQKICGIIIPINKHRFLTSPQSVVAFSSLFRSCLAGLGTVLRLAIG